VDAPARVTALATVIAGAVLAVPLLMIGQAVVHPASGYWLIAGVTPGDRPITVGLEAIGLCLALAAIVWFIGSRRFVRRDL
jgi:hypothetical protein